MSDRSYLSLMVQRDREVRNWVIAKEVIITGEMGSRTLVCQSKILRIRTRIAPVGSEA